MGHQTSRPGAYLQLNVFVFLFLSSTYRSGQDWVVFLFFLPSFCLEWLYHKSDLPAVCGGAGAGRAGGGGLFGLLSQTELFNRLRLVSAVGENGGLWIC